MEVALTSSTLIFAENTAVSNDGQTTGTEVVWKEHKTASIVLDCGIISTGRIYVGWNITHTTTLLLQCRTNVVAIQTTYQCIICVYSKIPGYNSIVIISHAGRELGTHSDEVHWSRTYPQVSSIVICNTGLWAGGIGDDGAVGTIRLNVRRLECWEGANIPHWSYVNGGQGSVDHYDGDKTTNLGQTDQDNAHGPEGRK